MADAREPSKNYNYLLSQAHVNIKYYQKQTEVKKTVHLNKYETT